MWFWRKLFRISWTARRIDKHVLDIIKLDISLESKILKQKLKYFGHIMRNDNSLEKAIMLGKIQGKRKVGRQQMRWIGEVELSTQMNLVELSKATRNA
jgi:hypothetical protein